MVNRARINGAGYAGRLGRAQESIATKRTDRMKLPADYACLSCWHSRCEKGKPTWCAKTNSAAKGRCKYYEPIAGQSMKEFK